MKEEIKVIYEDNHLLVVVKPFNVPSQGDPSGDEDMLTALKAYLKEKYNKPGNVYLGLVHRLDRPTGGVMVFAKTDKAAARLSQAIREGEMEKQYFAIVVGKPAEEHGHLEHYLKKMPDNTVRVVPATTEGAKRAELVYTVLQTTKDLKTPLSLVKIDLITGRSHQIRVQMKHIGCPVFGDVRYGGNIAKGYHLALFARHLKFAHPVTGQTMSFYAYPPEEEPWLRFDIDRFMRIIGK
ncbi:MAG: RluA family pseudouridine synthase [Clostridia bacterium]|nr:RluA family pseudouridine synthase [Clostridia bacterium]